MASASASASFRLRRCCFYYFSFPFEILPFLWEFAITNILLFFFLLKLAMPWAFKFACRRCWCCRRCCCEYNDDSVRLRYADAVFFFRTECIIFIDKTLNHIIDDDDSIMQPHSYGMASALGVTLRHHSLGSTTAFVCTVHTLNLMYLNVTLPYIAYFRSSILFYTLFGPFYLDTLALVVRRLLLHSSFCVRIFIRQNTKRWIQTNKSTPNTHTHPHQYTFSSLKMVNSFMRAKEIYRER